MFHCSSMSAVLLQIFTIIKRDNANASSCSPAAKRQTRHRLWGNKPLIGFSRGRYKTCTDSIEYSVNYADVAAVDVVEGL